jgi:hypothetical protein
VPTTEYLLAVADTSDERFWDALDAKSVYFTNDPWGELEMQQRLPAAFEAAGYKIESWGRSDTHPCWILRARRRSALRFADKAQLVTHVIELLRSAGIRARKADVTVDKRGDTILVAFVWPMAGRDWRFDEGLGWAPV